MNFSTSLFLCFFAIGSVAFSQDYSRVKIFANAEELNQLRNLGVTVDHGTYKENTFFISDFSAQEIQIMQQYGFTYEVLIPDVVTYYANQNNQFTPTPKNAACTGGSGGSAGLVPAAPSNFNLGTMGGYLKYNEMLAELDAMAAQFPNLITVKTQISNFLTHQNRPIYYVRLSDNANVDEQGEPKVLYTAIHHAREPMSLMETIFYMWYLLENYSSSEEIQYLVNNMQLYFVPCINPDGYVYNESTNPNGGGMWRKNRRNNGGNVYGVDLNRNYSYGWGTTGTSTNTSNDTYCGPSPFSEPETQAIRWLVQNNDFITAFNAHTYAEAILFPIGTTNAEFADHHDYFQAETNHMAQYNGYTAMKSSGLYPASGDSDDYMYKVDIGVGQKDTIFAHTPEVGTAFWQPSSQIVSTCQEMVFPNLVLAHITKKYVVVKDADPSNITTLSGNFNHTANRLGRENGQVTVSIQPLQNIVSVGNSVTHDLALMATANGAISYTLNPSIQFGDVIQYVLQTNNGLWTKRDTITKTYGAYTLQAVEDATTNTNWTGTGWGTTSSTFVSASKSFADSPTGNYSNNVTRNYTYTPAIVLTNATAAMITYYAKWNIEADYDYVQFQVSTDNGATWVAQCTNYTNAGNNANGSVQPLNKPVYDGVQTSWVLDEVSLSDYLGQTIRVRFQLKSDGGTTGDGFYFDDFKVLYNEPGQAVPPSASFNTSSSSTCVGTNVTFSDLSTGNPTSWSWDFGDNSTSTTQSPTHVYQTPGSYTVTLTVSNAAGSDVFLVTPFVVNALPTVTLTSNDADNTVCINNGLVNLTTTPSTAVCTGNGVSGNTFNPLTAGIGLHQIAASFTDQNGCVGTQTLSIVVENCASIENLEASGIRIVPNPNSGLFYIDGLELGNTYRIFDVNGKLIHEAEATQKFEWVEFDVVTQGVYYLQTTKNGLLGQMKFVVL
jgi:PKD repeat protein